MNTQAIRIRLIEKDLQLTDLARLSRIGYDRLQKILHGYRSPRQEEVTSIARILELPVAAVADTASSLNDSEANYD